MTIRVWFDAAAVGPSDVGIFRVADRIFRLLQKRTEFEVVPFLLREALCHEGFDGIRDGLNAKWHSADSLADAVKPEDVLVTCNPIVHEYQHAFPFGKCKTVAMVHDLIPWMLGSRFEPMYAILGRYDYLGCISTHVEKDLWVHFGQFLRHRQQTHITPHGDWILNKAPTSASDTEIDVPAHYILWMYGAGCLRKRFDVMVDALAKLPSHVHVCLPSEGKKFQSIFDKAMQKHPHLLSRVHVFPKCTDAQLQLLYARARCLVLTTYSEGFGLPVLEAAMHRLPIVLPCNSCLPEVAEGYPDVHWYATVDVDGLAEAVLPLVAEKEAPRRTDARAAESFLARYRHETFVDLVRDVAHGTVPHRTHPPTGSIAASFPSGAIPKPGDEKTVWIGEYKPFRAAVVCAMNDLQARVHELPFLVGRLPKNWKMRLVLPASTDPELVRLHVAKHPRLEACLVQGDPFRMAWRSLVDPTLDRVLLGDGFEEGVWRELLLRSVSDRPVGVFRYLVPSDGTLTTELLPHFLPPERTLYSTQTLLLTCPWMTTLDWWNAKNIAQTLTERLLHHPMDLLVTAYRGNNLWLQEYNRRLFKGKTESKQ